MVVRPRDFACMRLVHKWLADECDIMSNEYSLTYNKYVIDFCETTEYEKQSLLNGVIH